MLFTVITCLGSFILLSVFLCAWRFPLKSIRVFFGIVTGFLEHFCAGGGGGISLTIPENTCTYGLHWILLGLLYLSHSVWPDPLLGVIT